jgi:ABC-type lipoprotein export system ATPase subunit
MTYSSEQKRVIEATIAAFDGDILAAQKALSLLHVKSKKIKKNHTVGAPIITAKDVMKTYKMGRTTVQALAGVDVEICEGEFVAITGTSGSGKSTLLHLLGGLDKPNKGEIMVAGKSLESLRDAKLAQFRNETIGFVFQFFYLQPFLTLQDNIEVPAMFSRTKKNIRRTKSTELADAVGLSERLKHLPRELSGGQMQRAAIARAIQNNPKILFADEPTGNLDRTNAVAIFDLFEQIRNTQGTTIVVVTHDKELAEKADRVIDMQDGVVQ